MSRSTTRAYLTRRSFAGRGSIKGWWDYDYVGLRDVQGPAKAFVVLVGTWGCVTQTCHSAVTNHRRSLRHLSQHALLHLSLACDSRMDDKPCLRHSVPDSTQPSNFLWTNGDASLGDQEPSVQVMLMHDVRKKLAVERGEKR
ncbi:hypothetical protein BaRGS_00006429, partial [Batillaria attramentaria]